MKKEYIIAIWIVLIFYYLYLKYKKKEDISFILILFLGLSLMGAYYTIFCYPSDKNEESYFTVISQLVSGLFAVLGVFLTIREESKARKKDNKNQEEKMKEQLRLENIPILKFECNDEEREANSICAYNIEQRFSTKTLTSQLNINIKNVGLGTAQNIYFQCFVGMDLLFNSRNLNEVIEKGGEFNYSIQFKIPNYDNYHKRITFLVFYEDLLNNKYMQKLDGNISTYKSVNSGIDTNEVSCNLSINEKYKVVDVNYEYKIPEELVEEELKYIELEERQKVLERMYPNKEEIEMLTSKYKCGMFDLYRFLNDNFKNLSIEGGCGGPTNIKRVKVNIYDVFLEESYGTSYKETISVESVIRINIDTKEIKYISINIIKNSLNISKFKKLLISIMLKMELRQIRRIENKNRNLLNLFIRNIYETEIINRKD